MDMELSPEQQRLVDTFQGELTAAALLEIASGKRSVEQLATGELLDFLQLANSLYRAGEPLITDADYDFLYLAELRNTLFSIALNRRQWPRRLRCRQECCRPIRHMILLR